MFWWEALDKKRGSRPRSVLMGSGDGVTVAERLTKLVNLPDVVVMPDDHWMPYGIPFQSSEGTWITRPADEAKLGDPNNLLSSDVQSNLKSWWLKVLPNANTPNWDIASTCRIEGKAGLLLVEAKAHHTELIDETRGMQLGSNELNRIQIQEAIRQANEGLWQSTRIDWRLSRDTHYQMSNRFAWSWKLTQLGFPVVLIYLGFTNAAEMEDRGRLISDYQDWETAVHEHSRILFSSSVWGSELKVGENSLIPLIRVDAQPFPPVVAGGQKIEV